MRPTPLAGASRWIAASIAVAGLLCGGAARRATAEAVRRPNVLIIYTDAPSPHETFYWQLGRGPKAQWVVREGDWKLLGNPRDSSNKAPLTKDDKLFLANLAEDATEMKNLVKEHPDVVERLDRLHVQYAEDISAE